MELKDLGIELQTYSCRVVLPGHRESTMYVDAMSQKDAELAIESALRRLYGEETTKHTEVKSEGGVKTLVVKVEGEGCRSQEG